MPRVLADLAPPVVVLFRVVVSSSSCMVVQIEVLHRVPGDVQSVSVPPNLRAAEIRPVVRVAVLNVRQ